MEKVANQQSIPIWDRQSTDRSRGHKSSVDKAVQAHRDRVNARKERTAARLKSRMKAANSINERFFPKPDIKQNFAQQGPSQKYDYSVENEPVVGIKPAQVKAQPQPVPEQTVPAKIQPIKAQPAPVDAQQTAPEEAMPKYPQQMDDLYRALEIGPVRAHATEVAEKDVIETGQEVQQSDEVPKGSYVDYEV